MTGDKDGNEYAWQFTDADRVIVMYFIVLSKPAEPVRILKLADLDADKLYKLKKYLPPKKLGVDGGPQKISFEEKSFYGDELMNFGLAAEKIETDFAAYMWVFEVQ